ncbi:DUF4381 domain-containing protein [Roseibium aggregatum]|uniref:DUF4381 domain-containing protein n=1 Tax=Roseibium aggregatum TaxID=187304 RepID=UPI001A8C0611|nr:DUF4381 domain-containing protein [Roseibium aggregatum]MBN8184696.1 DUF4381 domain-containing protein [Roseibium aggregatum]
MKDEWTELNLVELLDLIEPAPEPPAISMLPQTEGWIWLIALLVLAIAMGLQRFLKRWSGNAYRRQALRELDTLDGDIAGIAALVRRTALVAYPRRDVAPLHGYDWLVFLDRTYGSTDFTSGVGQVLAHAPYGVKGNIEERDDGSLQQLVGNWIHRHQVAAP